MTKTLLGLLLCFASTWMAVGQANSSDAQALHEIAAELHAMRSELHQQTARNQTMQVLLFEMQTQQAVVTRATQRVDEARSKLIDVQDGKKHVEADIARYEETIRSTKDDVEKTRAKAEMERSKAELASLEAIEQERLTARQQASVQLQNAENTFDTIQKEVERFMQSLQSAQQQTIPN
jgi:chromosome segregation ATPase